MCFQEIDIIQKHGIDYYALYCNKYTEVYNSFGPTHPAGRVNEKVHSSLQKYTCPYILKNISKCLKHRFTRVFQKYGGKIQALAASF